MRERKGKKKLYEIHQHVSLCFKEEGHKSRGYFYSQNELVSQMQERKMKLKRRKKRWRKSFFLLNSCGKNPPDPNFMKAIKRLGNLSWQMPVGLVVEAYTYWV